MLVVLYQAAVVVLLALGGARGFELALAPVGPAVSMGLANVRQAVVLAVLMPVIAVAVQTGLMQAGHAYWLPVEATALYFGGLGLLGLAMGWAMNRRWRFGAVVAGAQALVFGLTLAAALSRWTAWTDFGPRMYQALAEMVRNSAPNDAELERMMEQIEYFSFLLVDYWAETGLGMVFSMTLVMLTIAAAASAHWMRRYVPGAGPRGSFSQMRPPETLVWLAIATALAWFVGQRWPDSGLQTPVWNTAIALGAVYTLNGIAIGWFVLTLWVRPLALRVLLMGAALLWCSAPAFIPLGLFDTWFEFRRRARVLDRLRRRRPPGGEA